MADRIKSIDTLRGLSVIFYLMFHFGSWLASSSNLWLMGNPGDLLLAPIPYLGMVAAPIFIMVSGMSQRISIERRRNDGIPEKEIQVHVIKRGLILLIFHFFLHFIYFYWEFGKNVWWWDEIATIAISMIMVYYTSKISIKWRLLLIGLMIYFYPALRVLLDITRDYTFLFYNSPWSLDRFFAGMISNGTCPIIPQSSMAVFGSILAEFVMDEKIELLPILAVIFSVTIVVTAILRLNPIFTPWDLGLHLIQTFGIWALIFLAIFWIQDVNGLPSIDVLSILSELSLTLFYIHVVFGYAVIFISGGAQQLSPYGFYVIFLFFVMVIFVLGQLWRKTKFKGSLEFLLRMLS